MIKHSEKGFTLIEMMIALSIIGFVLVLTIQQTTINEKAEQGRALGSQLLVFNNAVRGHISVNVSNSTYISNGVTMQNGTDWLKSSSECAGGLAAYHYLSCDFPEFLGRSNLQFNTELDTTIGTGKLKARTVIDAKDASGTDTVIDQYQLGLAALTANGGSVMDANALDMNDIQMQVDGSGNASTNISLASTDARFYFCPLNINPSLLADECRISSSSPKEGGLIVMVTETSGELDTIVRTDGSNSMHNNLQFDSTNENERHIRGVNRLYNLTGEVLKLGNSGVYYDGSWLPTLGAGLVIDTDIYSVADITAEGDLDTRGDIITESDMVVADSVYTKDRIITEGDLEVGQDLITLGNSYYNDNIRSFGIVDAEMIRVNSFADAATVYAGQNIHSDTIVNAQSITASVDMYSEGDISVSGDKIVGGNQYGTGDKAIQGDLISDGNILADSGNTFLSEAYASAIYDTDGNYMIDPSGISLTNIVRAENIVATSSGQELRVSSNRVVMLREDDACTIASDTCASTMSGYLDMSNVMVKSPGDGTWVNFIDLLKGDATYTSD